jgi:hypothetical protein
MITSDAGWSSLAARRAHNPKVTGSNPVPATKFETVDTARDQRFFRLRQKSSVEQLFHRVGIGCGKGGAGKTGFVGGSGDGVPLALAGPAAMADHPGTLRFSDRLNAVTVDSITAFLRQRDEGWGITELKGLR